MLVHHEPMRDERGSVTAEFAVVVPAVILVVLLTVATLSASGRQVRLEHAAAQAARLAARDEGDDRVRGFVDAVVPGASVSIHTDGDVVCITATSGAPPLPVTLTADACAVASEAEP